MKTKLLMFGIALLLPMQLVFAELVPEPGPICPTGTNQMYDGCVISSGVCAEGTTYKNGICQVNEIENRTKSSFDKWHNANECWELKDDGTKVPCTMSAGPSMIIGMSLIIYGPWIVGAAIVVIFIIWRKRNNGMSDMRK